MEFLSIQNWPGQSYLAKDKIELFHPDGAGKV